MIFRHSDPQGMMHPVNHSELSKGSWSLFNQVVMQKLLPIGKHQTYSGMKLWLKIYGGEGQDLGEKKNQQKDRIVLNRNN